MSDQHLSHETRALLDDLRFLATHSASLHALQQATVTAIARELSHYHWTGFYMLDPDDPAMLILGPFVGADTPHKRIPVSEGICGAAVATGETIVVDNVNADPRYLSCSLETRSEIVVPIYAEGKVIGEIDIDSHEPAAFKQSDRTFLEEIARIVGSYVENHHGQNTPANQSSS